MLFSQIYTEETHAKDTKSGNYGKFRYFPMETVIALKRFSRRISDLRVCIIEKGKEKRERKYTARVVQGFETPVR